MKTRRNKLKRITITIAAAFLLLLFIAYGYFSWRKYQAYQHTIHRDAEFIVKVDIDRLYWSLVKDYICNLSLFQKQSTVTIKSGLDFPAQLFVYTVKSKSAKTFFCTLPVADTLMLRSFLKQQLGIATFKDMGNHVSGSSTNGRLKVAFNTETFVAGFSLNGEKVDDVIADLLNKRNLLKGTEAQPGKLKASNSHLAYVFKDHMGTGDFKDGLLHIEGDFNTEGFVCNGKTFKHRVFDKEAAVKMWLSGKPLNKSMEAVKLSNYIIYPDSLLHDYDGYIDFEMKSPISQTDTVITYLYNDDFEKEETKTARIVKVPGMSSMIAADAVALNNYLSKAKVIYNGTLNKAVFPLYKVYANSSATGIMLGTNPTERPAELQGSSAYFFYLEADFDKIKEQNLFPIAEKYIHPLSRLVIKATSEATDKKHFEINLHFKRKDVNAWRQLR